MPGRRAQQLSKTESRLLSQMETAARSGDSATFFTTARQALQLCFSARWQVRPDELTAEAVDARLGSDGEDVRQIFALADEAKYAGHGMTTTDFERWTHIVRRQLQDAPARTGRA